MQEALFYLFAILAVMCGFLVVANPFSRNPVTSALFLVLTIVWLAGLYVLLHAFFLAAIQILVYAGAVMVIFLFVIMLLNLKDEERRKIRWFSLLSGIVMVGAVAALIIMVVGGTMPLATQPAFEGDTQPLGKALFTHYLLPFEMTSVLLLAGMMGVVILSRKEVKE